MGLTFQQKFYYLPDIYFIYDGQQVINNHVIAIIEKPEDYINGKKLESLLITNGYLLQSCDFDNLVSNGYDILRALKIDNRRKEFDIY